MLLGDLYNYSINEQNSNEIVASININGKHAIFDGHFPALPVLPGVCQVLMVREILSDVLKINLHLSVSKSIKFLAVVNPEKIETFNILIAYKFDSDNKVIASAVLSNGEQNILKMKGEFCERD